MVKRLSQPPLQARSSLGWLWLDTLGVPPCRTAPGCCTGCRAPVASSVPLLRSPDHARELKVKVHHFVGEGLGWFSSVRRSAGGAREQGTRKH